ncbi:hypothetical protein ACWEGS_34375 [Streptomyces sp. NPDC004822]
MRHGSSVLPSTVVIASILPYRRPRAATGSAPAQDVGAHVAFGPACPG